LRPLRIATACLLLALALLASPAGAQGSSGRAGLMIDKVNRVRARHGLPRLRTSPSLVRSAGRFSHWMMASDVFGHRERVSASGHFHRLGEALAMHMGAGLGVGSTVRQWLHSPSHRAIVLTRSMGWVGAGATRGRFHGTRATIWVLQTGG
jgi:uncharacterized protein YkwD